MPALNESNSSVDQSSGAVFYHKSPELLEIMKLREEVRKVDAKMDEILALLKGGTGTDGREVDKWRQCQTDDP